MTWNPCQVSWNSDRLLKVEFLSHAHTSWWSLQFTFYFLGEKSRLTITCCLGVSLCTPHFNFWNIWPIFTKCGSNIISFEETLKSHFLISCSLQEVLCTGRLYLSDGIASDGRAVQLCFVYFISFVKFQLRTQCSCELNFLFGDK